MDEFVVYIMYSEKYETFYTGFTSDLISRFNSHNYFSKKGYTVKFRPWVVVHVEFFTSKTDAIKRERFFKSGAGRQWRKQNIKY